MVAEHTRKHGVPDGRGHRIVCISTASRCHDVVSTSFAPSDKSARATPPTRPPIAAQSIRQRATAAWGQGRSLYLMLRCASHVPSHSTGLAGRASHSARSPLLSVGVRWVSTYSRAALPLSAGALPCP